MKTRQMLIGIGLILVGLLLIVVSSPRNSSVWLIVLGGGLFGVGIEKMLQVFG